MAKSFREQMLLAAEAWFIAEDVEDLVAFFPHADFEEFSQTGAGLRVYRTLDEATARVSPGPRWSLGQFLATDVPAEFQRYGFSLMPLNTLSRTLKASTGGIEEDDLGWLLWKAGAEKALSLTLWLLARDGLESPPLAGSLPPEVISDLARRAVLLISLGDPWAWRQGRHAELVTRAYDTLESALLRRADATPGVTSEYYKALADWHRHPPGGKDVDTDLLQMASHLRSVQRATSEEVDRTLRSYLDTTQQLVEVEQVALYPLASVRPDEETVLRRRSPVFPGERGRMRSIASQRRVEIACMSPVFESVWGQLVALREERRRVQTYEGNVDVLERKLAALLRDARRQRRLVYAPPHEADVLHFIYDHEVAELERHLTELKTARLEITPLAPHVELRREVRVAFELYNSGQAEARDVDLVLALDSGFELLEHSSVREFSCMPPRSRQRMVYRVRVVRQPDVTFSFSYRYAGMREHEEAPPIRLPVRSPDEAPFRMKGNPYKFGRTIQNPADFFGREEQMQQVLASLYGGGHADFLLRGPRRMGKTSMLYMLQHALENPEVRRRFHIPPDWNVALNRYAPVMLDLQAFSFQDDATHIARFFHTLLDAVCRVVVPDLGPHLLRRFNQRRMEIDPPLAVLEQLAEVFARRPLARAVVLLDEYDEIYRPQGRTLDTALRHVVQEEQRLTWVIASTQFLFKEGKSYGSPWFNILNIIELDCLSPEAARRLVEEPGRNEGVEWQSDAVVALLDETGRHPAFLQLFCSKVIAHLNQVKRNYVVPQTVADLAEQIVEERETAHSHFEFFWADTPGVGQLILLAAEESDHPPTRRELRSCVETQLQNRFGSLPEARVSDPKGSPICWRDQEFEDGIAWISQVVNALTFDRASRTYTFTVPLFRRWLQRRRRYEDLLETAMTTVATDMEQDGLG